MPPCFANSFAFSIISLYKEELWIVWRSYEVAEGAPKRNCKAARRTFAADDATYSSVVLESLLSLQASFKSAASSGEAQIPTITGGKLDTEKEY
jgi:hypothetical protein